MSFPAESSLLSLDENQYLIGMLDNPQRCEIQSTSVVQLYATKGPSHQQWHKQLVGVLCLIKDNIRQNYFFEMFSLQQSCKIWEHVLHANIEYIYSTRFFHVFEGEGAIFAFNFADDSEADRMKIIVSKTLEHLQRKKARKTQTAPSIPPPQIQTTTTIINHHQKQPSLTKPAKIKKSEKKNKKKKLDKNEIGIPVGFVHLSHISVDSTFFKDENVKQLFQKAGITEKHLNDPQTRDVIYSCINDQGGLDAVKHFNRNSQQKTQITPKNVQHKKTTVKQVAPPVPPRNPALWNPPPPNFAPPPPPVGNFAPPPPPPPSFDTGHYEAPPLLASNAPGALLSDIRRGASLKPVSEAKEAPPSARGNLLDEIRSGIKLKPADERIMVDSPIVEKVEAKNDLAMALAKAVAARGKVLLLNESDSDSSDDDDEWDC